MSLDFKIDDGVSQDFHGVSQFYRDKHGVLYPYVYWYGNGGKPFFSADEVKQMRKWGKKAPMMEAMVGIGRIPGGEVRSEVRKSEISWVSMTPKNQKLFRKVNKAVDRANARFYQMDIWGYEAFQYTTYKAKDEGKYEDHMDLCLWGDNMADGFRKLSVVICLTDTHEGGEFQYYDGGAWKTVALRKGDMIMFPSWLLHRVTKVTKGVRETYVTWVVGPKPR